MFGEEIGFGIFAVFIFALVIFLVVFKIMMLIDCVKRKFDKEGDKVVWVLVIIFIGFIGSIVYYFVVKNKDKKK